MQYVPQQHMQNVIIIIWQMAWSSKVQKLLNEW